MLRRWLHALLCLTLLSTAVASAWACPQLAAAWAEQAVTDAGGCPHHRESTSESTDDGDALPGIAQCCCPAPLPPTLLLSTLTPSPASSPPRWNAAPPPTPLSSPPLRPPADLHA